MGGDKNKNEYGGFHICIFVFFPGGGERQTKGGGRWGGGLVWEWGFAPELYDIDVSRINLVVALNVEINAFQGGEAQKFVVAASQPPIAAAAAASFLLQYLPYLYTEPVYIFLRENVPMLE